MEIGGAERECEGPTRERVLEWVNSRVSAYSASVRDFSCASWEDGLAFLCLVHSRDPGLFELGAMRSRQSKVRTIESAFTLASSAYGVRRLIEPSEIGKSSEDGDSRIFAQVCEFYRALATSQDGEAGTEREVDTESSGSCGTPTGTAEEIRALREELECSRRRVAELEAKLTATSSRARDESAAVEDERTRLFRLVAQRRRAVDRLCEITAELGQQQTQQQAAANNNSRDRTMLSEIEFLLGACATRSKEISGLMAAGGTCNSSTPEGASACLATLKELLVRQGAAGAMGPAKSAVLLALVDQALLPDS